MAVFVEAPFFPNASRMREDHIAALPALLLKDPLSSAGISFICKSYTPEDSAYI